MQKWLVLPVLAVFLLVVACGCTGSSSSPEETTPVPVTTTKTPVTTAVKTLPPTATPAPTLTVSDNTVISIRHEGFQPADVTIKAGSQVRWTNLDSTDNPTKYNPTHRIQLGNIKTSPLLSPGQNWDWTFRAPGVFDYSDLIHTTLRGTITVVP